MTDKNRNSAGIDRIYTEISETEESAKVFLKDPEDPTVSEWRFLRMYRFVEPLLKSDPGAHWLTVGDGRYGAEAQYLSRFGVKVTASDLYPQLLEKAAQQGLIGDYLELNAEAMDVEDGAFDYVLCKESYHHFPRPPVALYEMLRVSRKAVVLLEPNDLYCTDSIIRIFFRRFISCFTRLLFKTPLPKDNYEPVGNYVYRISVRELEKTAVCLDYPMIAFQYFNDHFIPAGKDERISVNRKVFNRTRRMIRLQNLFMKTGLYGGRLLALVIFKKMPDEKQQRELKQAGFKLRTLPRNPYI